ncbi:LytTR family DNA-binding domain-containing protein [Emticicia sp. BO119]|uniref:LytR/AlgR family response regulator transcription factor n=1 Tax=Emticicia sp. BO119 TaxID=2757768 RepID=UPI0015F0A18B|nr:LytTR family DNA-binding domain-containing protein [Emticicia sp. BO119]MBA4853484.1 response regulator transcription factor [Emticicia sp. BO119]
MLLKCVAIDDEPLALELIKEYISRLPELDLIQVFDDAIQGQEFLKENEIDLLFVDINMPDITGLELVKSLKIRPMIIFTTAHRKFAVEGFDLEAIDYLLKPVDFERFGKAVKKAIEYNNFKNNLIIETPEYVFVRAEYRIIKIELNAIEYIEGLEDYIKIHITGLPHPILTLMSLKGILEQLPAHQFSRIHRSYIVANAKVKSVLKKNVLLTSGIELPVSNTYQHFIKDWQKK